MNADQERRRLLKKMVYIPPAVLTLSAMPFSASYGSGGNFPGGGSTGGEFPGTGPRLKNGG